MQHQFIGKDYRIPTNCAVKHMTLHIGIAQINKKLHSAAREIQAEELTASEMHWVCPCTVSWLKNSPQSMHDSWRLAKQPRESTTCKLRRQRSVHKRDRNRGTQGWASCSHLGGVAGAEVAGELGLLEVLAAVLALEPHHRRASPEASGGRRHALADEGWWFEAWAS